MDIGRENVNKVRTPFRVIAAISCLAGIAALIIIIYFFFIEGFNFVGLFFLILIGWLVHLTFFIVKTGYPPNYLLWTTSKKEN